MGKKRTVYRVDGRKRGGGIPANLYVTKYSRTTPKTSDLCMDIRSASKHYPLQPHKEIRSPHSVTQQKYDGQLDCGASAHVSLANTVHGYGAHHHCFFALNNNMRTWMRMGMNAPLISAQFSLLRVGPWTNGSEKKTWDVMYGMLHTLPAMVRVRDFGYCMYH